MNLISFCFSVAQCECVISPEASDAAVRFLMTICNNSELKGASWKVKKNMYNSHNSSFRCSLNDFIIVFLVS